MSFQPFSGAPVMDYATCTSWNDEGTALAVGTLTGFIIYSTEATGYDGGNMEEVSRRNVAGGVAQIAIFGQSNIVLFSGYSHQFACKVTLWDDASVGQSERDGTIATLSLPNPVHALRLHPCLIVVAETTAVHLFDHFLNEIEVFGTPPPPESLAMTSTSSQQLEASEGGKRSTGVVKRFSCTDTLALASILVEEKAAGLICSVLRLVVLGPTIGSVRCVRYVQQKREQPHQKSISHLGFLDSNGGRSLHAQVMELHHSAVLRIAITPDGNRAVTVSHRGTAIKLIDVRTCDLLMQFSRGTTSNLVRALTINPTATLVLCISDSGTLHVFDLTLSQHNTNATYRGGTVSVSSIGMQDAQASSASMNGSFAINNGGAAAWSETSSDGLISKMTRAVKNTVEYAHSSGAAIRYYLPDEEGSQYISGLSASDGIGGVVVRPMVRGHLFTAFIVHRSTTRPGKGRCLRVAINTAEGTSEVRQTFFFPRDSL